MVTINDGGNQKNYTSSAETIGDLLFEQKIGLAATDRVTPALEWYLAEGLKITIDRIVDLEITETNEIPYEITINHNPEIYYGRESVLSKGMIGKKEQVFMITYKNGVEVKRKLLSQKVLEKPVAEIREFGTKIEIEDEKEGRASWYAYKGCMCAAYPVLLKGRYVRVFNLDTDKSIIVKINDFGPEQAIFPDRVIDLDSVAYKELAALGTGTIRVRVQVLKN